MDGTIGIGMTEFAGSYLSESDLQHPRTRSSQYYNSSKSLQPFLREVELFISPIRIVKGLNSP